MDIIEQASKIRLLLLDIDGILTDGMVYVGSDEQIRKGMHIQDGLGIKLLARTAMPTCSFSH